MDIAIVQYTCFNPVFKGTGLVIFGLLGILIYLYMKRRWKEPASFGFNLFLATAVFIVIYGLIILVLRPNWWALPY
jgi:hypothetical protein